MEPPLAKLAGRTPSAEEVSGSCEKCGNEYVRKKTTLVRVRAFVHGDVVLENADDGRKSDWKLLNTLRNQLMHGLIDEDDLGKAASGFHLVEALFAPRYLRLLAFVRA